MLFLILFRHVNPKNKTIEEKHCKRLEVKERGILEEAIKDQKTHLYRLGIDVFKKGLFFGKRQGSENSFIQVRY
jgi:hypothetical protein